MYFPFRRSLLVFLLTAFALPSLAETGVQDAYKWVPSSANILLGLDIENAKMLPAFSQFQKKLQAKGPFKQGSKLLDTKESGLLESAKYLVFSGQTANIQSKNAQYAMVFLGEFGEAWKKKLLAVDGIKPASDKDDGSFQSKDGLYILVKDDALIVGSPKFAKQAILAGKRAGLKATSLRPLLAQFKNKEKNILVIKNFQEALKEKDRKWTKDSGIQDLAVNLDFAKGLAIDFLGAFSSAAKAKEAHGIVEAQLTDLQDDKEVADTGLLNIVKSAKSSQSGKNLTLTAHADKETLGVLVLMLLPFI